MSLDLTTLLSFTLLWLAIVPTPGANMLMVTHVAMTRTGRHVALALLGNMLGIALLASLALLGWAAILEAFPWLRLGVTIFGGLYLMWFGWKLLDRARKPDSSSDAKSSREPVSTSLENALRPLPKPAGLETDFERWRKEHALRWCWRRVKAPACARRCRR